MRAIRGSGSEKTMARYIYPTKKGDPMIIHLSDKDSPYGVIHDFLHNLYWVQNMDGEGFCYSDMVVVWDYLADWQLEQGVKPYPREITIFRATRHNDDEEFGWFFNRDDWCEGEQWIFLYDCFMFDDTSYIDGKIVPMQHLDFDKVKGKEREEAQEGEQ